MLNGSQRKGLTLVESMVAMSILIAALGGLLTVFLMNQRTVAMANNLGRATGQARGLLEGLLALPYDHVSLSTGAHSVNGGSYTVSESNSVKTVSLTVTWSNALQRAPNTLTLVTSVSGAIHR
jgi:type II secretory pathway pseudopilin PulG